jgi:hypothetical protein
MQTHGIRHQERKLIFVAAMMVRADLLQKELPAPKTYRVRSYDGRFGINT